MHPTTRGMAALAWNCRAMLGYSPTSGHPMYLSEVADRNLVTFCTALHTVDLETCWLSPIREYSPPVDKYLRARQNCKCKMNTSLTGGR